MTETSVNAQKTAGPATSKSQQSQIAGAKNSPKGIRLDG